MALLLFDVISSTLPRSRCLFGLPALPAWVVLFVPLRVLRVSCYVPNVIRAAYQVHLCCCLKLLMFAYVSLFLLPPPPLFILWPCDYSRSRRHEYTHPSPLFILQLQWCCVSNILSGMYLVASYVPGTRYKLCVHVYTFSLNSLLTCLLVFVFAPFPPSALYETRRHECCVNKKTCNRSTATPSAGSTSETCHAETDAFSQPWTTSSTG